MNARAAGAVLPLGGLALLAAGAALHLQVPSERDVAAAQARFAAQQRQLGELKRTTAPCADELSDLLPCRRPLDEVLAALHDAARRAGVDAVTPLGATAEPGEAEQTVRCTVEVDAPCAALVRFLGLVESARPLVRVDALSVEPLGAALRARVEIAAPFCRGNA